MPKLPDLIMGASRRPILALIDPIKLWRFDITSQNAKSKIIFYKLTIAGIFANKLDAWISRKMAERSEAKNAKRSFASKYFEF